jgi:putative heme-binding domain-containing protein
LTALAAVSPGLSQVKADLFAYLLARLPQDQAVASRALTADVLSRAQLTSEQVLALTHALPTVGPMEGQRILEAIARTTDEKVGLALVAALTDQAVRLGLRTETLKPHLEKYPAPVRNAAAALYARLDAELVQQRARLEALVPQVKEGDVRRGRVVFTSAKAACAACHTIGYVGGKVGPDLTHIGKIRSERDLLESILLPSASFVRSYEPYLVTTKKGRTFNGVLRKDGADEVILAINATEEVRIAREDIEEMIPGKVSIMPAGLEKQLTPTELADLIAFLKACQ